MLLNSHLAFLWVWIAIATITSLHTHSGFHLPLGLSPQFHNYHHSHVNQNYGVLGIMDRIHKTDKLFMKSKESRRHKWLLTLKPSQEITSKDIYRTVKSVLVNQLVIYLGFYFLAYSTLLRHEYKSCQINYWRLLLQFLFCAAIQEIGFYYTHRSTAIEFTSGLLMSDSKLWYFWSFGQFSSNGHSFQEIKGIA
ncbi:unnamed protein product, partial [Oppiella nova]